MISPVFIANTRRAWCVLATLAIACSGESAFAVDPAQFAAPSAQSSATTPVIGTLRVTLAMFLVLGVVLAAAWLTRRLRGGVGVTTSGLQVLAQVSLGTRERAVLLRVGAHQLLIGVAPGNVRTLHVIDAVGDRAASGVIEVEVPAAATSPPTFKSLLLKSLGR